MRIAVFVLSRLSADAVHDGSQRMLGDICVHLGGRGHDVTVLSVREETDGRPFALAPRVQVQPVLRYKPTYPQPHDTAPYRLADVVARLRTAVADSDVLYVHGGKLLFEAVFEDTPTAVGVHDFVYPDTLAGAFTFRRDRLILPSDYLRACALTSLRHLEGLAAHVRTVPPGFDTRALRPVDASALRRSFGLAEDATALLWPHRTEPRKGLDEAIRVAVRARELVDPDTAQRIRLLVPRWAGDGGGAHRADYAAAERLAADLGAADLLHTHRWLAPRELPAYYSLGTVTLCPGSFVESFGTVAVESLLCDTPAVVARVGAHRSVLPDDLVDKVDHGDTEAAAAAVARHVEGADRALRADVAAYVGARYPRSAMLDGHEEALTTVERIEPLALAPLAPRRPADVVVLPPWCALSAGGLYDDYRYGYHRDPRLLAVAARAEGGVTVGELFADGIREQELDEWLAAGALAHPVEH